MIQITPHMRVLVAVEPADFRKGIDGIARLCRERLCEDPFCGAAFVFCNRLAHKRLSSGKFRWWPSSPDEPVTALQAHELQVLLFGGDPGATRAAPEWRRISQPQPPTGP